MKTKNVSIEKVPEGLSYEWFSYEAFQEDILQIKEHLPSAFASAAEPSWVNSEKGNMSWFGHAEGFWGVQKCLDKGWPELRERLVKMMEGIELELPVFPTQTMTRRRKIVHGDHGDTLDMSKVWSGHSDVAWRRPHRTQRFSVNTKRITLAFDVTSNAMVTNKMAMWRAALCVLLCDSLARAGRTFEVWVVDSTSNPYGWVWAGDTKPKCLWSAWMVKGASDPLVLDRLCGMVSVGFMRSAGFVAMLCGPYDSTMFGGALNIGLPATLRKRQENDEVVMRLGECYTREDCIREYADAWEKLEHRLNQEEAA